MPSKIGACLIFIGTGLILATFSYFLYLLFIEDIPLSFKIIVLGVVFCYVGFIAVDFD